MSKTAKSLSVLAAALASVAALAADPPDSALNTQNGTIATVEAVVEGADPGIRLTLDPGQGQPTSSIDLTAASEDDYAPRVEIASSGDLWVAWFREGSPAGIRVRKRAYAGGAWGSDRLASHAMEISRNPDLTIDGSTVWVAYEVTDGSTYRVAVVAVEDEPVPVGGRTILGATAFEGDLDVRTHVTEGRLWVSWVQDDVELGWSVYDAGAESWSEAEFEEYDHDSIAEARSRVEAIIAAE